MLLASKGFFTRYLWELVEDERLDRTVALNFAWMVRSHRWTGLQLLEVMVEMEIVSPIEAETAYEESRALQPA